MRVDRYEGLVRVGVYGVKMNENRSGTVGGKNSCVYRTADPTLWRGDVGGDRKRTQKSNCFLNILNFGLTY